MGDHSSKMSAESDDWAVGAGAGVGAAASAFGASVNSGSGHAPTPKNQAVSAQMSRMPRSSTKPELALRRELHARGMRFRVHRRDLPGTPDVVLTRARVAVFIDGCFWHGCSLHGVVPKNNRAWWEAKLAGNAERDRRKDAELEALGWISLRFWEHATVGEVADAVEAAWRERTGRGWDPPT